AIFTLFNAILLQSLPVREPSRLVVFGENTAGEGTSTGDPNYGAWNLYSYEAYQFLGNASLPFESLAAVRSGENPVAVRVGDEPRAERAQSHLVSGNYFSVLGVSAAMGRTLTPADDRAGAAPSVVVSYGFWNDRLRANPSAVGRTVVINGATYTIVGVTPREFYGERVRRPPDFWVPLVFQPQIELRQSFLTDPRVYWLTLVGRLAPGVTREQAQVAATTKLRQFLANAAGANASPAQTQAIQRVRAAMMDGAGGISNLRFRYSQPLRVLVAVVALVLLLACANVANLLLSRAAARRGEITVRLALGASRGRLIRQLLTESLLLAMAGAAAGVLLARWAVTGLLALVASRTTPVHATLDARVLAFTAAVACLAGIAFGIAPALAAGRVDLVGALKSRDQAGRGGRSFGLTKVLVVGQIAISLVLLVGATLFAGSLLNLEAQPLGFDDQHVLLARVNPRLAGYRPAEVALLYQRIFERVGALPGVQSATIARYSPLSGSRSSDSGAVEGYVPKAKENVELETQFVAPAYPATMGIALLQGRAVGPQDLAGAPNVGLVNETFVRKYAAGRNPIGLHFSVDSGPANVEIVGVLKDVIFRGSRDEIMPAVFLPLYQQANQFALDAEVAIRTAGDPLAAAGELRRAIADVDPNLPVNDPRALRDQVASNFDSQRLAARLVGFFGGVALVLACVGLYGIVTQDVQRRTGEIGMRMALGAERSAVLWMILRETVTLLFIGLVIGVPAAFGAARLVSSQLYGFSASAPGPFLAAAGVLSVVAVLTGLVPANRASRVDPMVALRYE
ncbi:MAG TPA: ABC transporter permease, partial [Vicinamibacterales bacterium]|nr:ABC transporter permease [Vicinamibacterales bacterium]